MVKVQLWHCKSVGGRLGGKVTTQQWNVAKQTYNKPCSDSNCVLLLWVVLLCWLHFTGVNGLRESPRSGRHDIKLWEWRPTMRDRDRERESWCWYHPSPSADMASNKKDWGEVIAWPCESCREHLHWVSSQRPHCLLSHKFSLCGWRDQCEADMHFLDRQSGLLHAFIGCGSVH